ncbi:hypothetical protein SERLA73DRAFT_181244 [Serpula lacrymans var. lacrymans S7.3]|uniref:Uncharacterized protein n=1 Tax=Serpula lacrymans var. lacrymans (strain S7.3) TaxID=936435 RepID=F8PXQ6_SERL3|nr:hypothetical protein SERLA73DRAFT_181244 [Serpula lacrymans var. lacrymans S7.3]
MIEENKTGKREKQIARGKGTLQKKEKKGMTTVTHGISCYLLDCCDDGPVHVHDRGYDHV